MGCATIEAVVGIDVGSTEVKVLVADRAGNTLSCERQETGWWRGGHGRVELPVGTLIDRVLSGLTEALRVAEAAVARLRVMSVAVTGMAESGVLLDRAGVAMHSVVAWFDQRGGAELAAVPEGLRQEFSGHTGLPLSPLCSFAKLNWLFAWEVSAERVGMWLNVPEYVAYVLGGEAVTEPSLASRTGLLDQPTQRAWRPALTYLGLPDSVLPDLTFAGTPIGHVRHTGVPDAARGAVVTVAGHDHPVASVANGVWHGEHLFDSCGTSEALLRVVSAPLRREQRDRLTQQGLAQGMHVLPERWALLGGTRGGFVLDRVLAMLGRQQRRGELDAQWLAEVPAADSMTISGAHAESDEVTVALTGGEVSPLGVWSAALAHAMAEADAVIAVMSAEAGPHQYVTAAGGWPRMASFRAAKERSLPDVRYSQLDQPSAYGAVIFAEQAARSADAETKTSTVDIAKQFTEESRATAGVAL